MTRAKRLPTLTTLQTLLLLLYIHSITHTPKILRSHSIDFVDLVAPPTLGTFGASRGVRAFAFRSPSAISIAHFTPTRSLRDLFGRTTPIAEGDWLVCGLGFGVWGTAWLCIPFGPCRLVSLTLDNDIINYRIHLV